MSYPKTEISILARSGEYVDPFQTVGPFNVSRVCRFCESTAEADRDEQGLGRQGFDRKTVEIPKGKKMIELNTTCGPTGKAYICLECARLLWTNLGREIVKAEIKI